MKKFRDKNSCMTWWAYLWRGTLKERENALLILQAQNIPHTIDLKKETWLFFSDCTEIISTDAHILMEYEDQYKPCTSFAHFLLQNIKTRCNEQFINKFGLTVSEG